MHEIQQTIEEKIARKTKAECREQLTELRKMVKKIVQAIFELQSENQRLRRALNELNAKLPETNQCLHSSIPRVSGESITRLRKKLGLSETDLAFFFGVTLVTVSRWEHGEQKLRLEMRKKVGELRKLSKKTVRQLLAEKRQKAAECKKA